ncbi:MAG: ATP-binding cassette domain-containing protein [Chloroflexi bacterium]|nr:ATP-binding cassette domain-containing protein [Chloroflexota bacterium]
MLTPPRVIHLEHISKVFPEVVARDDVSLDIRPGEVHALLGENGAGKTTIMNIVFGLYHASAGRIIVDDREVSLRSSRDAIQLGIGMVHQHFMLTPTLTAAENVVQGTAPRGWMRDLKAAAAATTELSERYHLEVDPTARITQLSVGRQQRTRC